MNQRRRKRSIRNTRIKTGKKIKNIRNINIAIKIEVKIKIRKKRRIKVVIMKRLANATKY